MVGFGFLFAKIDVGWWRRRRTGNGFFWDALLCYMLYGCCLLQSQSNHRRILLTRKKLIKFMVCATPSTPTKPTNSDHGRTTTVYRNHIMAISCLRASSNFISWKNTVIYMHRRAPRRLRPSWPIAWDFFLAFLAEAQLFSLLWKKYLKFSNIWKKCAGHLVLSNDVCVCVLEKA